jgi:hypothetical protein
MKDYAISFLLLFKPADHRTDPSANFKNTFKLYGGVCLLALVYMFLSGTVNFVDNVINPLSEDEQIERRINNREYARQKESKETIKKLDKYMSDRGLD